MADRPVEISIHAPRMGSDMAQGARPETRESFQSTLPGWGATSGVLVGHATLRHFNPRSPDGERHGIARHRPRSPRFQSTLPGWGATVAFDLGEVLAVFISIHAPRMGSDNDNNVLTPDFKISIHAPRMGSDRTRRWPLHGSAISIHAPRMGSDKARARNSRRH